MLCDVWDLSCQTQRLGLESSEGLFDQDLNKQGGRLRLAVGWWGSRFPRGLLHVDSPHGLLGLPHSMVAGSPGRASRGRGGLKPHHLFHLVLRVTQHGFCPLYPAAFVRRESLTLTHVPQRREVKLNLLMRGEARFSKNQNGTGNIAVGSLWGGKYHLPQYL